VPEDFVLAGQARSTTTEVLPLEDAVRHRLGELLEVGPENVQDLYNTLISAVERPLIEVVLERAGGNQGKAAGMLRINRNTRRKTIPGLGVAVRRSTGGWLGCPASRFRRSMPSSTRSTPAGARRTWQWPCWPAAPASSSFA